MFRLLPLAFLVAASLGCGDAKSTTAAKPVGGPGHDDHDHDRGKMKLVDAGPIHAGLTAHVSKDESNLEIVFETLDKEPKPAPQALTKFTATAKRAGDEKSYELAFEPGPKDERKTDPDGKCSRFEAKVPWMKLDDNVTVTAKIEIAGKVRDVAWTDFNPKKYNHADEKK